MDQIRTKTARQLDRRTLLNDAMNHLNERENFILRLRFYEEDTDEVAEEIYISQAQVSRLEKSTLNPSAPISPGNAY